MISDGHFTLEKQCLAYTPEEYLSDIWISQKEKNSCRKLAALAEEAGSNALAICLCLENSCNMRFIGWQEAVGGSAP